MNDVKKIEIIIMPMQKWGTWARRTIFTFGVVLAPIFIGIAVDSQAMQWAGFVFGFLLLLGCAKMMSQNLHFFTVSEARKYLDGLDA